MSVRAEGEESAQEPHNTLSTTLGRFIERLTYKKLAPSALLAITSSAGYFYMAAGGCNGLDKEAGKAFGESLYFSIITFTTLGYGDLAPIGWGRAVAGAEVLIGLCLTALLIGKVASERQSALLLLIYTSDQQRRLSGFSDELERLVPSLASGRWVSMGTIENGFALITSLQAYLMFQSHQGRLADFGNGSALRRLYRSMEAFLCAVSDALVNRRANLREEVALLKMATRLARLGKIMERFHDGDRKARATLTKIELKFAKINNWEARTVTCRRLEQVFSVIPSKPWPKHFHKAAAAQLGISHALFCKCMDELIRLGRI